MSLDIRPNPSVTGSVTGSLVYQGSYDAATNTPDLTSSSKGDFYIVSVGGTLAGVTLNVGDHIVFNQNASSPITSSMFDVIDNTDAVASVNGQTGVVVLDSDDISEGATNQYFTSARFDTQLATKDSDDITEGATNQYFTAARFDTQLATKDSDDISEGATNQYFTAARFDSSFSAKSTTDLSEGTNLYYTDGRFDTRLATKDSDDITEGATNQYFTSARFDSSFSAKSTTDLSEGTNLYFTDARADGRIGAADLTDLNDVSYTAGPGIDNYVLTYDNTTSTWGAEVVPSAPVTSVNTQTGAVVLDTDDVSEGSTNLYYTDGRFDTRLATKSTTDLSEGTNLYYTDGRFDTRLATKTTDDVSEGATNQYFTDARADARADVRIAAADLTDLNDVSYTAGPGIDNYVLTYDNSTSTWGAEVVPSAPVTSVNTQTGAVVLDTDDVSEGATNQYFTAARFDTQLATKSTSDLSEGTNLYYTDTRFDTRLATKSTTDLSEGTNLYYTDARADGRIGAADLTDLNDVSYTAGPGIDNYVLTFDNTTSTWGAEPPGTAPVSSVNTQTGAVSLDLDDVVTVGATTTTAITTGGLTVTGDIDPNADVTYYIGDENNRFISYYGDMNGAIRFKAKVDQTGGLSKGEVVYIKGVSGSVPTVGKAQANSSSTMPAFGLVYANANDTADVEIITFGNLEDVATNTFSVGQNLYVSSTTAGGLVNSAPTGESNLIQNIGFVVRSDASAGIIKVGGAGRTNATPNLDQDKIFLGNGSNQAVSTALSSIALSGFNNDLTLANVVSNGDSTTVPVTIADLSINADASGTSTSGSISTTASNYNIKLDPHGSGVLELIGNATRGSGQIQFNCELNSHGVILEGPPHSAAASYTMILPDALGTPGQFLKLDNASTGELSFDTPTATPLAYVSQSSTPFTPSTNTHYSVDSSSGNITANLPALSTLSNGEQIRFKLYDATNNLILNPSSGDLIDGLSSYTMTNPKQSLTLIKGANDWEIV